MKKINMLSVLLLFSIFLYGCWDVVNIEDRGFIVGSAIDIEDEENVKDPKLTITNQMVLPAGMVAPSQGGGGSSKAFINYTAKGKSIYDMEVEVAAISSKAPFYEHLAVLVVSEDVAKKEHLFSNLLDTYIRDVNIRRGMKAVVAKGDAKDLLEFTTPNDKLPALHIENLLNESSKQVGFLKPKAIGDLEEFNLQKESYVLPYLHIKEYLEYKSGAVFHGKKDKMVGVLNDQEMNGLELIEGEHTTKIIEFPFKEKTFAFKVIRLKSKVKVNPKNIDKIKVTIDIELEGIIKESFKQEDFNDPKVIKAVQKAISKEAKSSIEKTIKKGQEELGADIFGVWQKLESKHYDIWKKVKDDWEEGKYYFKDVVFEVNVKTEVYSTGATNKTK